MPPTRIILYLLSTAFAAYLTAAGSLLLTNSSKAATLLAFFVPARQKQRIHRHLPHINKARRLIIGTSWLGVGLLLAATIALTLIQHHP